MSFMGLVYLNLEGSKPKKQETSRIKADEKLKKVSSVLKFLKGHDEGSISIVPIEPWLSSLVYLSCEVHFPTNLISLLFLIRLP